MESAHPIDGSGCILACVINWNGWRDTVVCLQSLLQLQPPRFQVVVCDNGSGDGSLDQLCDWLQKQSGFVRRAGVADVDGAISFDGPFACGPSAVHLLPLAANAGYAGAINRSIAWGRRHLGGRDFWLLNNDIWAEPNALAHLVQATRAVPDIGLCGSVLLDWGVPQSVQAIGGQYSRALAVGRHLTALPKSAQAEQGVFFGIDYPVGASLFVTHEYLDAVGLMSEAYFLYYEEMDWAERGRRCGFRPAVALQSRVQHREGASTGSHGGVRRKSMLSEHYGVVNRLRITRRFWPACLPLVWLSLWFVVVERALHGEWGRALLVLRRLFAPWRWMRDEVA